VSIILMIIIFIVVCIGIIIFLYKRKNKNIDEIKTTVSIINDNEKDKNIEDEDERLKREYEDKEEAKKLLKKIEVLKESLPTNNKNIIIIDGLMYQNINFEEVGRMSWKDASNYAKNLNFNNLDGWRLPTREELKKLIDIKLKNSKGDYHFIEKKFIENMPTFSWFWTSEKKDLSYYWVIFFSDGHNYWSNNNYKGYVLCVK